ncbi:hypothetical protein SUGI_0128780 [Cryptomeria japonica]|nr:hypothetical protein SUGI_0128780 [Cryptomeria japonica]
MVAILCFYPAGFFSEVDFGGRATQRPTDIRHRCAVSNRRLRNIFPCSDMERLHFAKLENLFINHQKEELADFCRALAMVLRIWCNAVRRIALKLLSGQGKELYYSASTAWGLTRGGDAERDREESVFSRDDEATVILDRVFLLCLSRVRPTLSNPVNLICPLTAGFFAL